MKKSKTELLLTPAPLGKKSTYVSRYSPSLLFPLPRQPKRDEIQVPHLLPFWGFDYWTGYEVSWLNPKGKPIVAFAEFKIPCDSEFLIESKSFKLYLNSLNQTQFESIDEVQSILSHDLSQGTKAIVECRLLSLADAPRKMGELAGDCLDDLDIECSEYQPNASYLKASPDGGLVTETFHTHLLKSNCLVTGQPDWGSIEVQYKGRPIDRAGFLKYIVSLREHNEFHEQCVERVFMDITRCCKPDELTVYARYTRRGGLDINPWRSSQKANSSVNLERLVRQ